MIQIAKKMNHSLLKIFSKKISNFNLNKILAFQEEIFLKRVFIKYFFKNY